MFMVLHTCNMACYNHETLLLFITTIVIIFSCFVSSNALLLNSSLIYPFSCSNDQKLDTCSSYLYHINKNQLSLDQISQLYSLDHNTAGVKSITHGLNNDYLVSVPCTCKGVNGTQAYFYDTIYSVKSGDKFDNVSDAFYSGQVWAVDGDDEMFVAGNNVTLHLVCGCIKQSGEILTYTVQKNDTLWGIAELFNSDLVQVERLNPRLTQNPSYIEIGWVFFVPLNTIQATTTGGKRHYRNIIVITLAVALLVSVSLLVLFFSIRTNHRKNRGVDPEAFRRTHSSMRSSLQSFFLRPDIEDETDRPIVYSLEEVHKATDDFDENKKIGQGGYGSVYIGRLKGKEVAIKKMRSTRSKEFFAELKVLCKIHHINVVELPGYAIGDDHLYLVYEYISNGSLNDHLHDHMLKGKSPLSWPVRAHIALDAARGIEYIHDYTKAQYVHRDIKTSNILLDQGLRAKVADFGLAKLVERSSEENIVATRLVGTPGYIAPESVRELQMTSKTDVYAFGVVLAELITGQRALMRDIHDSNKRKTLATYLLNELEDPQWEIKLESMVDHNLKGNFPSEEVIKMLEICKRCLNDEPSNRPEMREVVQVLAHISMMSIEWEASLGGNSEIFSRILAGR